MPAAATASVPSTPTAAVTARSGPTLNAVDTMSSPTSDSEDVVGLGELAESEVDEPRMVVVVEEDVGEPEVAVGDVALAEVGDLLPELRQHVVGDRVVGNGVERRAVDRFVCEQHRRLVDRCDRQEVGRAHPEIGGTQRDECFVLDGTSERRERRFVADVAQTGAAVEAEEEIGVALVTAQDLHEHTVAVVERAEVRGRPACVDGGGLEIAEREPGPRHRSADGGVGGVAVAHAEREQHEEAHGPTGGEGEREIDGGPGAGDDAADDGEDHDGPRPAAPAP